MLTATGLSVGFSVMSPLAARIRHEERILHAVDGVDLTIERGEALALVGESGSGKSTLARALTGLEPLTAGEIKLDGKVLGKRRARSDMRRVQMVFQDPYSSLNPRLTVQGILHELLNVHHVVPRSEVDSFSKELIGLVGLTEDALTAYPRQFSGGQRQRVAIARALALRPELLVADEPVSALDVSVQATILNLLQDLRSTLGLTLLLISHNLAVVRHLCDRVAVMYLGRIIEVAPTAELYATPGPPLYPGAAGRDPADDPDERVRAGRHRRPAQPAEHPVRLPVPHPLPHRAGHLRPRGPGADRRAGPASHQAACHFAFGPVPAAASAGADAESAAPAPAAGSS